MKNFKYVILMFFFFVLSCQQPSTKDGVIYLNATEKTIPLDSLFSGMELIYLEEPDDILIGRINKIIKKESTFYLLDSDKSKAIYAYDNQGNYLSKFYAKGGGPNEYNSILDFEIDAANDEIVILCSPSKILITDLLLSLKKVISLNNDYYDRITIIGDNFFLYSYYNETIGKYYRDGELVDKINISNKLIKGNIFHPQTVFYKLSDKFLMQFPGDDVIYMEKSGEWNEYLYLDFENKISSKKLYARKTMDEITFQEKLSHPLPYIKCFFEFGKKDYFVYLFGVLHYLTDGNNNYLFSELPGVSSLYYNSGHLYTWEYIPNFNLEDPVLIPKFRNIEIFTSGVKNDFGDGILLINYIIK